LAAAIVRTLGATSKPPSEPWTRARLRNGGRRCALWARPSEPPWWPHQGGGGDAPCPPPGDAAHQCGRNCSFQIALGAGNLEGHWRPLTRVLARVQSRTKEKGQLEGFTQDVDSPRRSCQCCNVGPSRSSMSFMLRVASKTLVVFFQGEAHKDAFKTCKDVGRHLRP
jgi:hypothetical protein